VDPAEAFTIIAVFGTVGCTLAFVTRWIMAHRVEMKRLELQQAQPERSEEMEALRADVESVRAHLGEVLERLDFAERLLAQSRNRDVLERGP
jgi:hypothetical protein